MSIIVAVGAQFQQLGRRGNLGIYITTFLKTGTARERVCHYKN